MFGAKVPLLVRERPNILQRKKKVFILPNYCVIIFLAQSILFYKRVLFVCRKVVKMLSKYNATSSFPLENVSLMESGRSLTKRVPFIPKLSIIYQKGMIKEFGFAGCPKVGTKGQLLQKICITACSSDRKRRRQD